MSVLKFIFLILLVLPFAGFLLFIIDRLINEAYMNAEKKVDKSRTRKSESPGDKRRTVSRKGSDATLSKRQRRKIRRQNKKNE